MINKSSVLVVTASLFFFLSSISAAHAQKKRKSLENFIGLGQVTSISPYAGVDSQSRVIPLVYYKKGNFFLRGTRLGYSFYKNKNYLLSAIISARLMGYNSSQSSELDGIEDRHYSADSGLQLRVNFPGLKNTYFKLQYLHDILSVHNGQEIELALSKTWRHKIFRWSWDLGVSWQSSNLLTYYYGVQEDEVRPQRSQYKPQADENYFLSSRLALGLSQRWLLIVGGSIRSLAAEIQQSPIVDRDYTCNFILGIVRRF